MVIKAPYLAPTTAYADKARVTPVTLIALVIDGVPGTYTVESMDRIAAEMAREAHAAKSNLLAARVRLGAFLLQAKAIVGHAGFGRWQSRVGIHKRSGQKAVALAVKLADEHGRLSRERLFDLLHTDDPLAWPSIESFDADRVTLHAAEIAARIRDSSERSSLARNPKANGRSLLENACRTQTRAPVAPSLDDDDTNDENEWLDGDVGEAEDGDEDVEGLDDGEAEDLFADGAAAKADPVVVLVAGGGGGGGGGADLVLRRRAGARDPAVAAPVQMTMDHLFAAAERLRRVAAEIQAGRVSDAVMDRILRACEDVAPA